MIWNIEWNGWKRRVSVMNGPVDEERKILTKRYKELRTIIGKSSASRNIKKLLKLLNQVAKKYK